MKYIDMVRDGRPEIAVIAECSDAGFDVLGYDGHNVTVKAGCLPVEISWEMCSCHGGRMWLYQKNTNINVELSSDEYDEDKGIVDPETELAWRIENEMVATVKGFEGYVHVVEFDGRYGNRDRHEVVYFDSSEKAARVIFEEDGHDVFVEQCPVLHQYPNPDMRLLVEYDADEIEKGVNARRIRFKCTKLVRKKGSADFDVDYEYTAKYWVYRKGLR